MKTKKFSFLTIFILISFLITIPVFSKTVLSTSYPLNNSFELIKNRWVQYWTRNNKSFVKINSGYMGSWPNPKRSLKLTGQKNISQALSELIPVDFGQEYIIKAYFNMQNFQKGYVNFYIDEYDENYNWVSGKWLPGSWGDDIVQKTGNEYSPTSKKVKFAQVDFYTEPGSNLTIYIDEVTFTPKNHQSDHPKISITFDDGYKSAYEKALPILSQYNMKATAYVVTDWIGKEGHVTWNEIQNLQNTYLWEIGSHSKSHPSLTLLSKGNLKRELSTSKKKLENKGIEVKSFASPYGEYNAQVLSYIARYYQSHRTFWNGINIYPYTEEFANDYSIRVVTIDSPWETPVSILKTKVDQAISKNLWLVFVFHDLKQENAEKWDYYINDFQEFIEYLDPKNIEVVTISEGLDI